ncbi:hypothetical protein GQ53DRAFT_772040 [Thozetella sp. PMI_491]|nr:hypothetical protein GQ53DRAFT_772040 [Thozetella sp. PMI_491]
MRMTAGQALKPSTCFSHAALVQMRGKKQSVYLTDFQVDQIQDMCNVLGTWTRHKLFQILHEHRGLFHAVNDIPPISSLKIASEQSLRQHLESGAFLRGDRDNKRPADFFGPREKQILALKLSRCLLEFFDSETTSPSWDSDKVYLVAPSGRFADPVLLAFAKLLLEIDLGVPIDLSQCQSREQQWGTLCQQAFNSERGGSGLFAEAVKGCLYLHLELRGESQNEQSRDSLRRIIQHKVRQRDGHGDDGTEHADFESHIQGTNFNELSQIQGKFTDRLPKRQRTDRTELRSCAGSINTPPVTRQSTPASTRASSTGPPHPNRMTVFRAREVPPGDRVSTSEIVRKLILDKLSDAEKEYAKFSIKDVSGRRFFDGSERGTALVIFRGLVPKPLQAVIRSREDSELFSNDSDDEEDLSMDLDTKFIGATQLYEPPPSVEIAADIIAIHGLNGHPYGSWLSKSAKPKMWLSDFLHEDAKNCRIIIYGYKSNIFDDQAHPRHELYTQAERLRATLKNVRNTPELEKRPIIFIAHSYGGLVLARTLIEDQTKQVPSLWATKALFLFACPSRGFHVQDILDTIQAEREASDQDPISDDKAEALVRRLGEGDFRNELSSYPNVISGKKVAKNLKSGVVRRDGPSVLAAPPNSVIIGLPSAAEEVIFTDKDHSDIVKFASRGDATYQDVKHRIQAEIASIMDAQR